MNGVTVTWKYLARLLAVSALPGKGAWRWAAAGMVGLAIDLALFQFLIVSGKRLASAHVASFAVAGVVVYFLKTRTRLRQCGRSGLRIHGGLAIVACMALFLRGCVLALFVFHFSWPPLAALLCAICAAAVVAHFGTALCITPAAHNDGPRTRWRLMAFGVAGYLFVLRLVCLGLPELLPEEAYYWNYAQHLDIGYLDHPPMVAWLISLGTGLFGQNEFGVRIGAVVCWMAAAFFSFRLTRNLFHTSAALGAVILLQTLPFFFAAGFWMMPDVPLTAAWAGALYFFERALVAGRRGAWLGVGACMGLGMISKYSIALLGLAALLFILMDRRSRRWLWSFPPYAGTALAVLIFSPVIVWNWRHEWISFAFQSSRRLAEAAGFHLPTLLVSIVALLTPTGMIAAFAALSRQKKDTPDDAPGTPDRRWMFVRIFTLAPLAVFFVFSLRHTVKLEWTGPLWLAAVPGIAFAMQPGRGTGLARRLQPAWLPTITGAALLYGVWFHYLVLGLPGAGWLPQIYIAPVGWREFGAQVSRIEDELHRETKAEPLVIGMDRNFIASELAFYRRDQPQAVRQTSGCHLFGGMSLMYELWLPAKEQAGRTCLLISFTPRDLDGNKVKKRVSRLGPIREGVLTKDGRVIRHYFYRFAYGYGGREQPARAGTEPGGSR